jgi:hypothetical protein
MRFISLRAVRIASHLVLANVPPQLVLALVSEIGTAVSRSRVPQYKFGKFTSPSRCGARPRFHGEFLKREPFKLNCPHFGAYL